MVRTVLSLLLAATLLTGCRSSQPIEQQLQPLSVGPAPFEVHVVGDSVRVVPLPQPAPRRGFLGLGRSKVKNSGNVTINITHADNRRDQSKTDNSVTDKSQITVKEKTDVVSKPTTKTKSKVDSKSKTDDHAKTKTTQGGALAYIGLGAVGILFLIFLIRKKSRE